MPPVDIVLDFPGKNALGSASMAALRDQLAAADGAPVLLRGAGDCFCAGLNLAEVSSLDAAGMERFLDGLEALVSALFHHPGPTVAAVNGHAIAGGAVVALCCDHIVGPTASGARIGLNEVALGLRFPPGTLQVIRHRIPRRHHAAVLLGAALHTPDEALRLGLLDELADDPVAVGRQRLAAFARHPADAYAATKADLHGGVGRVSAAVAAEFSRQAVPMWTRPALQARLAAMVSRGRKK